jgi:hypothetical protein
MTASSHFWSFCVRNAHLSNTNQPEMEMRPDDATSWREQKSKGRSETFADTPTERDRHTVMTTMIADVMGF